MDKFQPLPSLMGKIFITYCQCTMTATQMIKRICISSKFEQLNNLKSKWSREIAQAKVPTTAFSDGERKLPPKVKTLFQKYCQCTMSAIQMIKRIPLEKNLNSFLEKYEDELPSQNKTHTEFILISTMYM